MTELERVEGGEGEDLLLTQFPLLEARANRRQPKTVEDLPAELLEQIHDRSVLENGLPYLNTAWASTDRVDTYYTRMLSTSLQNFADDATAGISMQNSHHTDEQSLGRTYRGTYKNARGQTPARAEMDFYIPPGLMVNGTNTDHIIQGIRWGTVSDVSVGFYGGGVRCAMCQKPMMRDLMSLLFFGGGDDEAETRDPAAPCNHLPGLEYNVRDQDGKKTGDKAIAIGEIDGARCAELSFVFDGATPQAKIAGRMVPVFAKAYRMAELDALPKDAALLLEQRYRGVRFPNATTPKFFVPQTTGLVTTTTAMGNGTLTNGSTTTSGSQTVVVEDRDSWTTSNKNDLPDSAFAYIESGGEKDDEGKTTPRSLRHFPHHDKGGGVDLPHLRNALARVEGGQSEHAGKAKAHLEKHAKAEGIGDRDNDEELVVMAEDEETRAKKSQDDDEKPWEKKDADQEDDDKEEDDSKKKRALPPVQTRSRLNGTHRESVQVVPTGMTEEEVRSLLVQHGLVSEDFHGTLDQRFRELADELENLRDWADIGQQARDALVDEVRKAGVRAYGARSFREAAFGPILTRGTYKELQALLEQFEDLGATRFQQGRATVDEEEQKPQPEPMKVPARAYRS